MADQVRTLPSSPRAVALALAELAVRADDPSQLVAEVAWRLGGADVSTLHKVIATQAGMSAMLAGRLASCRTSQSGRRVDAAAVLGAVREATFGGGSSP